MNLYNLHADPQSLRLFVEADEYVPKLFWGKYRDSPEELRKRERAISKDAEYAYSYARSVLNSPFPSGEEAISKNSYYSYRYARDALKGPFPAGEEVISTDAEHAYLYAKHVLMGSFPKGEEAISKNSEIAYRYSKYVLDDDFYLNGKLIADIVDKY